MRASAPEANIILCKPSAVGLTKLSSLSARIAIFTLFPTFTRRIFVPALDHGTVDYQPNGFGKLVVITLVESVWILSMVDPERQPGFVC
jgi:hypothetical protein